MKREILLGSNLKIANSTENTQKFFSTVKDTMAKALGEKTIENFLHAVPHSVSTFRDKVKSLKHNSAVKRALVTGTIGAAAGGLGGAGLSIGYNPNDPESKEKRMKNILKGVAIGGAAGGAGGYISRLKAHTKGSEVAKGLGTVLKSYTTG